MTRETAVREDEGQRRWSSAYQERAAPKEGRPPLHVRYGPPRKVKVPTGVNRMLLAVASKHNELTVLLVQASERNELRTVLTRGLFKW